jgi:K+-transporting ATPase ATPase C chain
MDKQDPMLRPAAVLLGELTLLVGLAYPLLTTSLAGALFPREAAGSLLLRDGRPVGSALIGQAFGDPGRFWSRPSATAPMAYNASASGGSNLGPLNPALVDAVKDRVAALRAVDPGNTAPVPVDLVTASASGLDPHISPEAARDQVARVARVRKLPLEQVSALVEAAVEQPLVPAVGPAVVNVLRLNLALEQLR